MGRTQRMVAVAAVAHARHFHNHTTPATVQPSDSSPSNINFIFASATLCGVLVMVCAACWRRKPSSDKPEDVAENRGVYTVSTDSRLSQVQMELPGPPPAYESVVEVLTEHSKNCHTLEEVVTEPRPHYHTSQRRDSELPSYEAAVLLKDTKL